MKNQKKHSTNQVDSAMLTVRRCHVDKDFGTFSRDDISNLRKNVLGISQNLFAQVMHVAPQTVHAWEQGCRTPSAMAQRMFKMMQKHPDIFRELVLQDRKSV